MLIVFVVAVVEQRAVGIGGQGHTAQGRGKKGGQQVKYKTIKNHYSTELNILSCEPHAESTNSERLGW